MWVCGEMKGWAAAYEHLRSRIGRHLGEFARGPMKWLDVVITWTVGTPRQRHQPCWSCVGVRQYSTVWRGEECDQRENHKHERG